MLLAHIGYFLILSSHMWLMATILDSAEHVQNYRDFYWIVLEENIMPE
jgi:hypothetical protein